MRSSTCSAATRSEIAGRFVGDDQHRVGDDGPAIATRCCSPPESCGGRCVGPVGDADRVESRLDVLASLVRREGREKERQLDVLGRCEHRKEVVELEHEADVGRAPVGELGLGERREVGARHDDGAATSGGRDRR